MVWHGMEWYCVGIDGLGGGRGVLQSVGITGLQLRPRLNHCCL